MQEPEEAELAEDEIEYRGDDDDDEVPEEAEPSAKRTKLTAAS